MEICGPNVIEYMAPLSRQTDFFVPEMVEEEATDVKEEDSDEDRGTDITGTCQALLINQKAFFFFLQKLKGNCAMFTSVTFKVIKKKSFTKL